LRKTIFLYNNANLGPDIYINNSLIIVINEIIDGFYSSYSDKQDSIYVYESPSISLFYGGCFSKFGCVGCYKAEYEECINDDYSSNDCVLNSLCVNDCGSWREPNGDNTYEY
jgi:hypothetical protein